MRIYEKSKSSKAIMPSSLICCLYTLDNKNKFFKQLNLKNDIYLDINNENDYFSTDIKNFDELYKLINKIALRRFVFLLLKPIIIGPSIWNFEENQLFNPKLSTSKFKTFYEDATLLKIYLQKFKYNYRLYFFYQNGNYEFLPTDKELNMFSIRSLFFLIGI